MSLSNKNDKSIYYRDNQANDYSLIMNSDEQKTPRLASQSKKINEFNPNNK